ncbi:MAG: hypothetical protein HUJ93_04000, partial [Bacteroidales bacterium]|nr:hypothetical protein [Bacteroidales bacterium]
AESVNETVEKLKSTVATLNEEMTAFGELNTTDIKNFREADAAFTNQVSKLSAYSDSVIKAQKDWANATLATLSNYNSLVDDVMAARLKIGGVNSRIDTSLDSLETSLKGWINSNLEGYYTLSKVQIQLSTQCIYMKQNITANTIALGHMLDSLKTEFSKAHDAAGETERKKLTLLDSAIQANLDYIDTINARVLRDEEKIAAVSVKIDTLKQQVTDSYNEAIKMAVDQYKGEIRGAVADSVVEINRKVKEMSDAALDSIAVLRARVETVDAGIDSLETQMNSMEEQLVEIGKAIDSLGVRIQSVACIDAGGAKVIYDCLDTLMTISFQITPTASADALYEAYQQDNTIMTLVGQTLLTRAGDNEIEIIPNAVKYDGNGILTFTAKTGSLGVTTNACIYLSINFGTTAVCSSAVGISSRVSYPSEGIDMGVVVNGNKVIWAPWNMGATGVFEIGSYVAWGEFNAKAEYSNSNYFDPSSTAMTTDLTLDWDVANKRWGDDWKMPSKDEFKALIDTCTITSVTDYEGSGVDGYLFVSKVNGNKLFFPAVGYYTESEHLVDSAACYWTSSIDAGELKKAWFYYENVAKPHSDKIHAMLRCNGANIRPVYLEEVSTDGNEGGEGTGSGDGSDGGEGAGSGESGDGNGEGSAGEGNNGNNGEEE